MLGARLRTTAPDDEERQASQADVVQGVEEGIRDEELRDEANPGVVIGVPQTAKGGPEAEVADDVERGPVQPLSHVDGSSRRAAAGPRSFLAQLLDQQVDVRADDGLLAPQGLVAEAVRDGPPQRGVLLAPAQDDVVRVGVARRHVEAPVLGELLGPRLTVAVDVVPGLRAAEGDLPRHDPHDRPVPLVQLRDLVAQLAAHQPVCPRYGGDAP